MFNVHQLLNVGLANILVLVIAPASFAAKFTINFTELPSFSQPSFSKNGLTITGSNNISNLTFNGFGIEGGQFDFRIDSGEFVNFSFKSQAAANIIFSGGVVNFEGIKRDGFLEAFGVDGNSLGLQRFNFFSPISTVNVSSLYSNQLISSFRFTAETDSRDIGMIEFEVIPEPLILLGVSTAVGFGTLFKRQINKKRNPII